MRRAALTSAVLGLLLAFGAPAAPAQEPEQIRVVPSGTPTFPERSYRLTVPERRGLAPEDIKVTENGEPVSKLQLGSGDGEGGEGGEFGAILVIDASASMHGAAIDSAVAAARALAGQRGGGQQLGIVIFNNTTKVLLAPTADQAAIDAALSRNPPLAPQTHIFDAVSVALDQLDLANIAAGSVVVLSDGADTGSRVSPAAVKKRARAANIAIHTVGLRSRAFDVGGLRGLAAATGGQFAATQSAQELRRVFRALGAQLASDYLVRYRSNAQPGREVTVAVRIDGLQGLGTRTYQVPGDATFVQFEDSFWGSNLGTALTALLSALLLAMALAILLARRVRGPTLRERIANFATPGSENSIDPAVELTGRPRGGAERSLERTAWWPAFKLDVEIARIDVDAMRIMTGTVLATLVFMFLLVQATGIVLVGLFALAVPWGVRTWVRVKRDRQRALFTDQLPDVLQGAASAIRAGHGLVAALSMVAEDAPEPTRTEFRRVVADEALGVPLEEALRVVQARMNSSEVLQIALVAQIQRDAGGNMAEVLDRITESLRQSGELRRMVKALTAQGRLSRWVVTALPIVLLLVISVASPAYIRPLFTETLGLIMLAVAGVMMAVGSMIIGKIVDFQV